MYKGKCVICQNWKTFESEWSVRNYTEKNALKSVAMVILNMNYIFDILFTEQH